ncbi:MAG: choice-of-anchor Q domain-containing protein [Ardenticatenaceae bacterium]|nr:choice-of-anchor Q domain-containing protein [Ardenticatenaceae bacterium]
MTKKLIQAVGFAALLIIGGVIGYAIFSSPLTKAAVDAPPQDTYLPVISYKMGLVYYVAPNGQNKSSRGSYSQPWATIEYAVNQVEDGALILVQPGTYNGRVELVRKFPEGITIRAATPYQARLRNDDQVVICFKCQGVTIEGFDIAHSGPGAGRYVIQIQDVTGSGGRRVTLRNNIVHDSYNNDLLKINSGARDIIVEGNMFYNQNGQDNHVDVTSGRDIIIQDNIFFNDFAGSNRPVNNNTGSFLIMKDANGDSDGILGAQHITVRRNIFLNWQGDIGNAFINLGDGSSVSYHHAHNITIENNLFIGNSDVVLHSPFKFTSARKITVRHNTIVGDLPSKAFGFRLADGQQTNNKIFFYNNIWADPTGTMGEDDNGEGAKFASVDNVGSYNLDNNLYWNNGQAIPTNANQPINFTDDNNAFTGNPRLENNHNGLVVPRWIQGQNQFADGSAKIKIAFAQLVEAYGRPAANSAAIDNADPSQSPETDILGQLRSNPDIGAYEMP